MTTYSISRVAISYIYSLHYVMLYLSEGSGAQRTNIFIHRCANFVFQCGTRVVTTAEVISGEINIGWVREPCAAKSCRRSLRYHLPSNFPSLKRTSPSSCRHLFRYLTHLPWVSAVVPLTASIFQHQELTTHYEWTFLCSPDTVNLSVYAYRTRATKRTCLLWWNSP